MNNQLIKRIINTNNEPCPEFLYHNPLLDKNVTDALSKSFIKILKISNQNSTSNNNVRLSVLQNIRKICKTEPEGHSQVDDHFTEFLTEIYKSDISERANNTQESVDKKLDAFLVRKLTHMDVNSSFQSIINPEVIQALINLNQNGVYMETLAKDIIHWNVESERYSNVLKELWNHNTSGSSMLSNDISIKMKPQIEMLVLNICNNLFETRNQDIQDVLKTKDSTELLRNCLKSTQCFQMCSGILNFLFIMTNFNPELQKFIPEFAKYVKLNCSFDTCALYPFHLSSLVILLDFELDELPESLKDSYIQPTISQLHKLHKDSENDLILLLSHFPQWFDIYFYKKNL
ncbi:uncharacterized protein LOC134657656 [Cydia amplana]|uniref:uncharacterized protein LOC134657656 n=1 Tax=Cydia amplana TaxID=1869771 RepID=UPI002FE5456F